MTGPHSIFLTLLSTKGAAANKTTPRTHIAVQLPDCDYPQVIDSPPPTPPPHTATTPQLPHSIDSQLMDSSPPPPHTATTPQLPHSIDSQLMDSSPPHTPTTPQLPVCIYPQLPHSSRPQTLIPQLPNCVYPQISNSSLTHTHTTPHLRDCNNQDCRCTRFWDQSLDQLHAHLRAPDANHPRSNRVAPVPDETVRFRRPHTAILIDGHESGTSPDSEFDVELPQSINHHQDVETNEQAQELGRQTRFRDKNRKVLFKMQQLFVGARSRGRYIYRPARDTGDSEDCGAEKGSDDTHEQLAWVVNGVAWFMVVLYLFYWCIRATMW